MDREDLNQAQRELNEARAQEPQHTTSAAKEYDPNGLEGTTLENAPNMGQDFDQVRSSNEPTQGQALSNDAAQQGIGSGQVQSDALTPELRPPPEIAGSADRQKHASEMQQDNEASRLANYEAMADRIENQNQQDQGYDIGR